MDNLVQGQGYQYSGSVNLFGFDHILIPSFSDQNLVNGSDVDDGVSNHPNQSNLVLLKYISQMLMEEDDWENKPGLSQDSLEAAEKSLYDALGEEYPPSQNHNPSRVRENVDNPDEDFARTCSSSLSTTSPASVDSMVGFSSIGNRKRLESSRVDHYSDYVIRSDLETFGSSSIYHGTVDSLVNSFQVLDPSKDRQTSSRFRGVDREVTLILPKEEYENYDFEHNEHGGEFPPSQSRGKKNHYQEDDGYMEAGRSNKQLASYDEDSDEPSEMYDKVLLCPDLNPHLHKEEPACICGEAPRNGVGGKLLKNGQSKGSSGGKQRGKKQGNKREVVDLMTLLTRCAQAVASVDSRTANELLKQIRQHSSPRGDGTERTAHYFANALEARLAGTGRALDASLLTKTLSTAEALKAYLAFRTASPFNKMSIFIANKMIWKLAEKATRLHIIDFGIIHGFQWPGLIQHLSLRPGGPPRVRITGIDFPQPGFRPAERVEETGRFLAYYCERFNVPFEYNGVAKKWDTIRLEDLKIQRDEVIVVNCLFRLRYVTDETVGVISPRDAVLNLIKRINPNLFIHGIVNGTYNGPFFVSRFREVLLQSYAVFDMFDAILPRENEGRMLYEREVFGRGAMSVVACEGTERVIRPETYKQWQIRNVRAGLRQLPLDREISREVRDKVKLGYHKDFVVDEDSNWILQGWKGRIVNALSCWKPAQ